MTYDLPTSTLSCRLVIYIADFPARDLTSSPTSGFIVEILTAVPHVDSPFIFIYLRLHVRDFLTSSPS